MQLLQRKSPRRSEYDYSSAWMYFVTICTGDREEYFGDIVNGYMKLSEIWYICDNQLHIMLSKRPWIELHEYVIMPDHIHILFWMDKNISETVGTGLALSDKIHNISDDASIVPTAPEKKSHEISDAPSESLAKITNQTLWSVIWWRKSAVSKECREKWLKFARQKSYNDRIVRDAKEYDNIVYYIQQNPSKRWQS